MERVERGSRSERRKFKIGHKLNSFSSHVEGARRGRIYIKLGGEIVPNHQ